MLAVVRVDWRELERGWGDRPDGYSLHASIGEANKYIEKYWEGKPAKVPDEYSCPGTPFLTEVDEKTHSDVEKRRNIRVYQHEIPYKTNIKK